MMLLLLLVAATTDGEGALERALVKLAARLVLCEVLVVFLTLMPSTSILLQVCQRSCVDFLNALALV